MSTNLFEGTARTLVELVNNSAIEWLHSQGAALEFVAKCHGYRNWNTIHAKTVSLADLSDLKGQAIRLRTKLRDVTPPLDLAQALQIAEFVFSPQPQSRPSKCTSAKVSSSETTASISRITQQVLKLAGAGNQFRPFEIIMRDSSRVQIVRNNQVILQGKMLIVEAADGAPDRTVQLVHDEIASIVPLKTLITNKAKSKTDIPTEPVRPALIRSGKFKVIIADDQTLFVEGVVEILKRTPDIEVVGTADNGLRAVQLCKELNPDVILLAVTMPNRLPNGATAAQLIRKENLPCKIIGVSSSENDVITIFDTKAEGFILKQCSGEELIAAIREVCNGHAFFKGRASEQIMDHIINVKVLGKQPATGRPLTTREREVLKFIAEGKVNKQMAVELGISIKSIEKHRQQLMNKLDIHDIAGLTRYAIKNGVIQG